MINILDIILWMIIIGSFILSFVGLVYPIIPSVLMIWIGIVLYHFGLQPEALSWIAWLTFGLLTVLIFLADYLVNLHFVKKAGGSAWGKSAATIGLIVGSFVIPPFGVIVVPFALVLLAEMMHQRTFESSLKVASATLIGFLSSTFAKAIIQLIMIFVFFFAVIF